MDTNFDAETQKVFDYNRNSIDNIDKLLMIAEEAAELSQAALKLIRKLRGSNPTPKTLEECENDLMEEAEDISTALATYYGNVPGPSVSKIYRFYNRLIRAKYGDESLDEQICRNLP